jgi:hypothetical protein
MSTKNFSIPKLRPVFSFTTQEGDEINIYAAKTKYTTALLITLVTDELVEYTWAVTTGDYPVAFRELVEKARDTYSRTVPSSKNPFDELLNDVSAMNRLENIINKL